MGRVGGDVGKDFVELMGLPITGKEFFEMLDVECDTIFANPVPVMPGAAKLVEHLHKHDIPIAVATSSRTYAFNMKTKHHPEMFSRFRHVVIASEDPEISAGKPDPQTFLVCASRFSSPPENMKQCLVFEDSVAGVESGNSAGAYTVWVPDPRMDRSLAKPHTILDSLEHFKPEDFGLPPFLE